MLFIVFVSGICWFFKLIFLDNSLFIEVFKRFMLVVEGLIYVRLEVGVVFLIIGVKVVFGVLLFLRSVGIKNFLGRIIEIRVSICKVNVY